MTQFMTVRLSSDTGEKSEYNDNHKSEGEKDKYQNTLALFLKIFLAPIQPKP